MQKNFKVELNPIAKRIGTKGSIPRFLRRMKNNIQGYPLLCYWELHLQIYFFNRSFDN
jgi:hypothetical protein